MRWGDKDYVAERCIEGVIDPWKVQRLVVMVPQASIAKYKKALAASISEGATMPIMSSKYEGWMTVPEVDLETMAKGLFFVGKDVVMCVDSAQVPKGWRGTIEKKANAGHWKVAFQVGIEIDGSFENIVVKVAEANLTTNMLEASAEVNLYTETFLIGKVFKYHGGDIGTCNLGQRLFKFCLTHNSVYDIQATNEQD